MKPQINSDFSQIRAIEVDRVKGRIASRPGMAIYAVNRVKGRIASRPGMAIYAVNRAYLWNSDPWLKAWPLLSLPAAAGIRRSIPACPPCAGVHPWLRNEETNL